MFSVGSDLSVCQSVHRHNETTGARTHEYCRQISENQGKLLVKKLWLRHKLDKGCGSGIDLGMYSVDRHVQ